MTPGQSFVPQYAQDSDVLRQVADGFTYNLNLDYLPGWSAPHLLAAMAPLRRAANFRPRYYAVPDGASTSSASTVLPTIDVYETYRKEIQITPGAWIWGYAMVVPQVTEQEFPPNPITTNTFDVAVQVTSVETNIPLFEEFIVGSLASSFAASSNGIRQARVHPVLLTEPRLVTAPGKYLVEIANRIGFPNTDFIGPTDSNPTPPYPISAQFIICTSEPCRAVDCTLPAGPIVR